MEFKVALEEAVNELGLQQLKPKQLEASNNGRRHKQQLIRR